MLKQLSKLLKDLEVINPEADIQVGYAWQRYFANISSTNDSNF
ncbi:hypothetical protein [Streptomyces murinus]